MFKTVAIGCLQLGQTNPVFVGHEATLSSSMGFGDPAIGCHPSVPTSGAAPAQCVEAPHRSLAMDDAISAATVNALLVNVALWSSRFGGSDTDACVYASNWDSSRSRLFATVQTLVAAPAPCRRTMALQGCNSPAARAGVISAVE